MTTFVYLMGGLGNQLFQYAFAKYLDAAGVPVSGLVTNSYDSDTFERRPLILDLATIPAVRIPLGLLGQYGALQNEDGAYLRGVLAGRASQAGPVICRGYWQAPGYAQAVADALALELAAAQAQCTAPVAADCVLHVRRRDYGHHGLLPRDYYLASLEHAGWPSFSVVTDEPNFCIHQFKTVRGFGGVVRGDHANPWSDFWWMSRARVQVIANSSFSWWTAWYGAHSGRAESIYAPSEWSLMPVADPCPGDWVRVPCRLARP